MKITHLKANKYTQRVSIFLDGDFAFSLHTQTVLKNSLNVGKSLNTRLIKALIIQSIKLELYTLALAKISTRLHSQQEVSLYLNKVLRNKFIKISNPCIIPIYQEIKDNHRTLIDQTIKKLEKNNYLNDLKFAQNFASYNTDLSKKGPVYIKQQLIKKGVKLSIIDQVITDPNLFKKKNLNQNIKTLIIQNYQKIAYKHYPKIKLKKLLIDRLIRRGYTYHQVVSQIDEFISNK